MNLPFELLRIQRNFFTKNISIKSLSNQDLDDSQSTDQQQDTTLKDIITHWTTPLKAITKTSVFCSSSPGHVASFPRTSTKKIVVKPTPSTSDQKDKSDPAHLLAVMAKKLVDTYDSADRSVDFLQGKIISSSYLKELISVCKKVEFRHNSFLSKLEEICTEEQNLKAELELSESTANEFAVFASIIDATISSYSFPLYKKVKVDNEGPGSSLPKFEHNLQVSKDFSHLVQGVVHGLEACVLKLYFIVNECIYLESYPGQRIICKEDSVSQLVQLFKLQFTMSVEAFISVNTNMEDSDTNDTHQAILLDKLPYSLHLLSEACRLLAKLLVCTNTVKEEVSYSIIYFCLDVCCSSSTAVSSSLGIKSLVFDASNLLCAIFAQFPDQRRSIIEDVITKMAKKFSKDFVYKFLDSKGTIHSYSALLFQIVISCCSSVSADRLCQDLPIGITVVDSTNVADLIDPSKQFIHKLKNNVESCIKAVDTYLSFLIAKCTSDKPGKKNQSTLDINFKTLFESILADQLIQLLNDPSKEGDSYMRNIATDWLGKLSSLLRKPKSPELQSMLTEFYSYNGQKSIEFLYKSLQDMISSVFSLSVDKTSQTASAMYLISSFSTRLPTDDDQFKNFVVEFALRLAHDLNIPPVLSRSDCISSGTNLVLSLFQHVHPLWQLHDKIILSLMKGFEADSVPLRTKSIRSLGEVLNDSIVSNDLKSCIVASISERMMDASPTVRETAIDAIGKYALDHTDDAVGVEYCSLIASRIMDVKVSVRKKVVKFLKDVFYSRFFNTSEFLLVDVLKKLIFRLGDEETSVRDLVEKILIDLYLSAGNAHFEADFTKEFKALHGRRMYILCACEISQRGISTLFHNFLASASSNGDKFSGIGVVMVNNLMDTVGAALRENNYLLADSGLSFLYQISRVFPKPFVGHLSSIHSLIDFNDTETIKISVLNHSVMIIRQVVETVKNLNDLTMKTIQSDLQKILQNGSQPVLKASIPCLCSVIQYQTKSSEFLVHIVQKCYGMLVKFKKPLENGERIPANSLVTSYRALLILVPVVSFFDFECEYRINSSEYSNVILQQMFGGSKILDLVFELSIVFCNSFLKFEAGQIGISALGNLFIQHPEYMIREKSLDLMKFTFSHSNLFYHYELLLVYLNYLELQQNMNNLSLSDGDQPEIDINVLVGNAGALSNEGIPTAIMQAFLLNVLADMLLIDFNVSFTAFKIISLALDNGLVHPIQCIPALCAMESNPEELIAQQALVIHRKLHEKHPSFIHSKIMESLDCIYQYQKSISSSKGVPLFGHKNGKALFNPMYSLIRQQKSRRNQFLKMLVSLFDVPKYEVTQPKLEYHHFMAENLVFLDYKSQEEVFHVVYFINLILSVSGETLRTELDGFGEDEFPTDVQLFKANCCIILVSIRDCLQKRFGLSFTQILNSTPASNHANTAEKNISIDSTCSIEFRNETDQSDTVAVFLEIMDDCLGSDDIEYTYKLPQLDAISPVDASPIAKPENCSKKRRTPLSTPKSDMKRKKSSKVQ